MNQMNSKQSFRLRIVLFLLLALFAAESVMMVYHSGQCRTVNDEVMAYRNEAIANYSRSSLVLGDIEDRNGTKLLEFTVPITQGEGTYIDNMAYSNLIGKESIKNWGLMNNCLEILRYTRDLSDEEGSTVTLTLDHELQMAAYQALKDRIGENGTGSIVVTDAESGEILAMVSLPSFDITGNVSPKDWYPAARTALAPPGSIFKTVSAMMLIDNGMEENTELDSEVKAGGKVIHNYYPNRSSEIGYEEALRVSSNVFFARSMMRMGMENAISALTEYAKKYYIGETLNLDFAQIQSSWPFDEENLCDLSGMSRPQTESEFDIKKVMSYGQEKGGKVDLEYHTAAASFGQSEIRLSTIQAAMISASIINDGKLVKPYMVESAKDCHGTKLELEQFGIEGMSSTHGQVLNAVTSAETAAKVRNAMQTAAVHSYGFDETWNVMAKSGTSETGNSGNAGNNSWMISAMEIGGHKYSAAVNWVNAESGIAGKDMAVPLKTVYGFLQSREKEN